MVIYLNLGLQCICKKIDQNFWPDRGRWNLCFYEFPFFQSIFALLSESFFVIQKSPLPSSSSSSSYLKMQRNQWSQWIVSWDCKQSIYKQCSYSQMHKYKANLHSYIHSISYTNFLFYFFIKLLCTFAVCVSMDTTS